jgi:hypothetical protein
MARAALLPALAWALWLGLLAPLLAGCESGPIVRGSGSEHRQAFRVGLPF